MDPRNYSAGGINCVGAAAPMPPKQPTEALWSAVEQLKKVTDLAHEMTDRLCGCEPEATAPGTLNAVSAPGGVFQSIDSAAREVTECMSRIAYDMGRISSRL